ncbi:MAG: M42 family metallopeptidase [Anaerolineae bacterium]|nr:M42 family metallopeptidase [Anaerolineae bacterium]
MFDLKAHLKTLVETHAPSGHEAAAREVIRESWDNLVQEFDQDKLGSLIGIKRATLPNESQRKIMLSAHMDEIGLMVRDIVDGFIYVHSISGVDNRVMLAQPVIIHGKRPLFGVVAAAPPHLLKAKDRKKYPSFDQLVIDIGLPADELASLVQIGDLITPDAPLLELQGSYLAAKAMDDRASVAAVTLALHELQKMQHCWDVYATATVQEESGLLGAKTAAYHIKPDIAIAIDVTFADQPGVPADDASEMGAGPAIGLGANFHPKLFDKIVEVAKEYEIKYQIEPAVGATGTDAAAIQLARDGIPTLLLSIPIRNMHSPVETLHLRDIERTGRLMAQFIASLDNDFLSAIAWDKLQTETSEAKG